MSDDLKDLLMAGAMVVFAILSVVFIYASMIAVIVGAPVVMIVWALKAVGAVG